MGYENSQLKSIIVHDVYVFAYYSITVVQSSQYDCFWSIDNPENSVFIKNKIWHLNLSVCFYHTLW
jgi:hypothetical protein